MNGQLRLQVLKRFILSFQQISNDYDHNETNVITSRRIVHPGDVYKEHGRIPMLM